MGHLTRRGSQLVSVTLQPRARTGGSCLHTFIQAYTWKSCQPECSPFKPSARRPRRFSASHARVPIGSAQLVSTWDDYQSQFGGVFAGDPPDLMGQTVSAFFANGGSRAYIVRLADGATAATALLLDPSSAPAPTDKVFRLSASSAGAWANSVSVQVTPASETSSRRDLHGLPRRPGLRSARPGTASDRGRLGELHQCRV